MPWGPRSAPTAGSLTADVPSGPRSAALCPSRVNIRVLNLADAERRHSGPPVVQPSSGRALLSLPTTTTGGAGGDQHLGPHGGASFPVGFGDHGRFGARFLSDLRGGVVGVGVIADANADACAGAGARRLISSNRAAVVPRNWYVGKTRVRAGSCVPAVIAVSRFVTNTSRKSSGSCSAGAPLMAEIAAHSWASVFSMVVTVSGVSARVCLSCRQRW